MAFVLWVRAKESNLAGYIRKMDGRIDSNSHVRNLLFFRKILIFKGRRSSGKIVEKDEMVQVIKIQHVDANREQTTNIRICAVFLKCSTLSRKFGKTVFSIYFYLQQITLINVWKRYSNSRCSQRFGAFHVDTKNTENTKNLIKN